MLAASAASDYSTAVVVAIAILCWTAWCFYDRWCRHQETERTQRCECETEPPKSTPAD